jgi:hypothetical protein
LPGLTLYDTVIIEILLLKRGAFTMNAWVPNTVTLPNLTAIGASQSDAPISKKFPITAGGSKNLVICITVSAASGTVTGKVRTSLGTGTAVDSKTVSITGAGDFYIKFNSDLLADQTYLPLLSLGEVVVTTASASSVTVTAVQILQED